jgi:hypothetical protein
MPVISVTAPLQIWSNEEGSSHFMVLPEEQAIEVRVHSRSNPRGFGSVRVECTLGEIRWRTSLLPRKDGGYFLPVKIDVCRRAGIVAGDEITVALELL